MAALLCLLMFMKHCFSFYFHNQGQSINDLFDLMLEVMVNNNLSLQFMFITLYTIYRITSSFQELRISLRKELYLCHSKTTFSQTQRQGHHFMTISVNYILPYHTYLKWRLYHQHNNVNDKSQECTYIRGLANMCCVYTAVLTKPPSISRKYAFHVAI